MRRRQFMLAAVAILASGADKKPAAPQAAKSQDKRKRKYATTPADAVFLAMVDAAASRGQAYWYRYIWVPTGDKAAQAATNYVVNSTVSSSRNIAHPQVLGGGAVLRYDLRTLAKNEADARRLLKIWDEKQAPLEPYFLVRERGTQKTEPYRAADGKVYDYKDATLFDFGLHTERGNGRTLAALTAGDEGEALRDGRSCPIVRYDWFWVKATTSIEDGLYYDWLGLERNPAQGTAQDAFLARIGANERESVEVDAVSARAAIMRSGVTGKHRRVEAFYGRKARPTDTVPIAFVTHDQFDEDQKNTAFDPIRNLAFVKDRAREIIQPRQNGLLEYGLFDGNGALQDFVPDNIAKDHKIPEPYTAKLNGMLSCVRCHGPHDGMIPFDNSVKELTSERGLRIYGDIEAAKRGQDFIEALEILTSQYSGDLEPPMMLVRNGHAQAAFRATGGRQVNEISALLVNRCNAYNYGPIEAGLAQGFGPEDAVEELGLDDQEGTATEILERFLPPIVKGAPFSPEDPVIGYLKLGKRVNRLDWEHVYKDAALRAMATKIGEDE